MLKLTVAEAETFMRLFHAIPETFSCCLPENVDVTRCAAEGVVFVKNGEVCEEVTKSIANIAMKVFGLSNIDWSKTFHKSWDKVAEAPIEQLVFEQVVHYFSTYGLESLGLEAKPLIPAEPILCDLKEKPNVRAFTIVEIVSNEQATKMLENYIVKVKAPNSMYVNDIISMMDCTLVRPDDIQSFELKVARYDQLDEVPQDGQDFLRYIIYKTIGSTLVIKNKETIKAIKQQLVYSSSKRDNLSNYFKRANLVNIAKVFLRFKPLFLAFKCNDEYCRQTINKVRRLADIYHQPLPENTVANISKLMSDGKTEEVEILISKCSGRQLIKMINFSACTSDVKVYTIRNGKTFVDKESSTSMSEDKLAELSNMLYTELITRIKTNKTVSGKTYYIPSYIQYAVPCSEKQMIGNIPFGTSVTAVGGEGFCMGIYWENYKNDRTDIDLHMMSSRGSHYGWNARYRNEERTVLFSGDLTDATDGAAEAFSFIPGEDSQYVLTASNYTHKNDVPFKFLMTNRGFTKEYGTSRYCDTRKSIDVADALFTPVPLDFGKSSDMTIGVLNGFDFYFYNGKMGEQITPNVQLAAKATDALCNKLSNMMPVELLLLLGDAKVLHTEDELNELTDEERAEVIDLSPSLLTERQFLDIVDDLDIKN